jgi:hypothetical protein
MPVAIPFDIGAPRFGDEFMTSEFSTRSRWMARVLAAIAPQRVAHSVSSAIRRFRRMIPGRHSPSSNFPTSVSITIDPGDQRPHCLVADRDMQSTRQMSASRFLSPLSQRKDKAQHESIPFRRRTGRVRYPRRTSCETLGLGCINIPLVPGRFLNRLLSSLILIQPPGLAAVSIDRGGACGRCN